MAAGADGFAHNAGRHLSSARPLAAGAQLRLSNNLVNIVDSEPQSDKNVSRERFGTIGGQKSYKAAYS